MAAIHPMTSSDNREVAYPLARRTGADPDSAQVADGIVALLREIDAALVPIFGQRGVAALYNRSLALVVGSHPWLSALHDDTHTGIEPAALRSVIAGQERLIASAGGTALLQAFRELLGNLIGLPLAGRLLDSAWAQPASIRPAQDKSTLAPKPRSDASRQARQDGPRHLEVVRPNSRETLMP